jgi:hypothetical protein
MMEEKKGKKKQNRREKRKRREKRGEFFWNLCEGWASEKKKTNPPQCLWFKLNGLGSSQNDQNSLIYNWCIGGCWFTQAHQRYLLWFKTPKLTLLKGQHCN